MILYMKRLFIIYYTLEKKIRFIIISKQETTTKSLIPEHHTKNNS